MALFGTGEMFEGKNNYFGKFGFGIDLVGLKKLNNSRTSGSGMEFESDWMKHLKSSVFTAQIIFSTTSFMAWSTRISINEGSFSSKKKVKEPDMCFSNLIQQDKPSAKSCSILFSKNYDDFSSPILPGLPDDVSKLCLALVSRSKFPAIGSVCKRWRSFIKSKEFITVRKLAEMLEEWLYVLTVDANGKGSHWEVLDCLGHKHQELPPMPGPTKAGFGVVVLNGKLMVIAGYCDADGPGSASSDLYQYDSFLGSWSKLASMNVARFDFACAEVNGLIYAIGGCGTDGESLSCVEVYDPDTDKWTMIESLRRPRWGCFACGVEGKLYVMGGRSSFTIGNSRFIDVYNPESHTWCQTKNGCVMVTAHAVLGEKLCCMEWKNERKLAIFNPVDNSWKMVAVPLTGSSSIGFRFGIMDGKLLLFSLQEDPGYHTLLYDPNAESGCEWQTSEIKPSGLCLCTVTIKA